MAAPCPALITIDTNQEAEVPAEPQITRCACEISCACIFPPVDGYCVVHRGEGVRSSFPKRKRRGERQRTDYEPEIPVKDVRFEVKVSRVQRAKPRVSWRDHYTGRELPPARKPADADPEWASQLADVEEAWRAITEGDANDAVRYVKRFFPRRVYGVSPVACKQILALVLWDAGKFRWREADSPINYITTCVSNELKGARENNTENRELLFEGKTVALPDDKVRRGREWTACISSMRWLDRLCTTQENIAVTRRHGAAVEMRGDESPANSGFPGRESDSALEALHYYRESSTYANRARCDIRVLFAPYLMKENDKLVFEAVLKGITQVRMCERLALSKQQVSAAIRKIQRAKRILRSKHWRPRRVPLRTILEKSDKPDRPQQIGEKQIVIGGVTHTVKLFSPGPELPWEPPLQRALLPQRHAVSAA